MLRIFFERIFVVCLLMILQWTFAQAQTYTWVGGTGDWNVSANWSPSGIPGAGHVAIISGSSVVTIPNGYTAMCKKVEVLSGARLIILSTGALHSNGSDNDAVRVWGANSELLNSGSVLIGNVSTVAWRGISLESGGKVTNNPDAVIEINRCNNQGILLVNVDTRIENSGIIRLGNLSGIASDGIEIAHSALLKNNAAGTVEIDSINSDGLRCYGSGTKISNDGKIFIGKKATIMSTCFRINDQAEIENSVTGQIEINNTKLYHGIDMWGSNTKFNNYGSIKIGNVLPIQWNGFYLSDFCVFNNHSGAFIEIDRSGNGFEFRFSAMFNNYGDLRIGNLAPINNVGITMYGSPKLENFSSGMIEVNNVNNYDGIIIQNSGTVFKNAGYLKVGNLSPINNAGIVMLSGASMNNTSSGNIEVNNTLNWDAIAVNQSGTSFMNSGWVKIGNLFPIKRTGIIMADQSSFVNASSGQIEINNITNEDGISISNAGTQFSNLGILKIGNLIKIKRDGMGLYSQSQFTNQAGGLIEINKVNSRHGINLEGSSTSFTNSGLVKVGSTDGVALAGIKLVTGSDFINNNAARLEIDSTGDDAIQVFDAGSSFTNSGEVMIGDKFRVAFYGFWQRTGSTVNNQASGTIRINRALNGIVQSASGNSFSNSGTIEIGNGAGIRGLGMNLTSASVFTNQAGTVVHINQTGLGGSGNGISLSGSGTSFSNFGTLRLGNTAPIKSHGIQLSSSAVFNNKPAGVVDIDSTQGLFAVLSGLGTTFNNEGQFKIGTLFNVQNGIGNNGSPAGTVSNTGTMTFGNIALDGIVSNQTIQNNSAGVVSVPSYGILKIAPGGLLSNNAGSTTNNSGIVTNNGAINNSGTFNNNGTYKGTGNFNSSLFSNPSNGTVSPGLSPGCLYFTNGWSSSGVLAVEINGPTACSDFDQLVVTGNAGAGGDLYVNFGFTPSCGQQFQIISAGTYSGGFAHIYVTPANLVVNYSNGFLQVWNTQASVKNVQDNLYYCTLSDALFSSQTNDSEVVQMPTGTYSDPCFSINKSVTFRAVGGPVTIDCMEMNGMNKILILDGNFVLNNLTLTSGLIRTNGNNLKCGSITGGNASSYVVTD